jgi:hypothetical protein
MTVVHKPQFDITNGMWFPLLDGDEKPKKNITVAEGKTIGIDCLFCKGNGDELYKQTQEVNEPISGTIQTTSGEHNAMFLLAPSNKYKNSIEKMHSLFKTNGILWTAQNCGYLLRFIDVMLLETSAPDGEEVFDYKFESEMPSMQRSRIPVWNVHRIEYDSTWFSTPSIDTQYFEHTFPTVEYGKQHGYLIEGNADILSIRNRDDEIIVMTVKESFEKWGAFRIVYRPTSDLYCFDMPIMHNEVMDTFAGRYISRGGILLQSRLEMFRQVEQYDMMDLVSLEDVSLIIETETFDDTYMSLMNTAPNNIDENEYMPLSDLNWFISDDFVNRMEQKVLLFKFKSLKPHFLSHDLISFIISQMQRQFNEYRCEAMLETWSET